MINAQENTTVPLERCKSLSMDRVQVMCKAVSEDELGAYSLFELTVPPQAGPSMHTHHWEEEAYYILEGELLIQESDRTFTAAAGSFVDFPKGVRHTFKNVGTVPARILVIVTPAWYGKCFEQWVSQRQKNPFPRLRLLRKT